MISWMVRVARARGVRLRSPMARDEGVRCMVCGEGKRCEHQRRVMRRENAQLYAARAGGRWRSDRRLDGLKLADCCSKTT